MAYAHVQMMLYRPFLHYISPSLSGTSVDKRPNECAAACIIVSRNIVNITMEMKKRGLLIGAFWFTIYTTFFAILALVFFVLENLDTDNMEDILHEAYAGRDTLAALANRSLAADRCTEILQVRS